MGRTEGDHGQRHARGGRRRQQLRRFWLLLLLLLLPLMVRIHRHDDADDVGSRAEKGREGKGEMCAMCLGAWVDG